MSKLHRWGVEIEAAGLSYDEVRNIVNSVTDDVCIKEERTRSAPLYWVVTYDGTIVGDRPFELRTPAMTGEKESWDKLRAVCTGLRAAGATVNKSCGLHVHHDGMYILKALNANNRTVFDLHGAAIGLYARLEPVLDGVMPLSRRYSLNSNSLSFRSLICARSNTKLEETNNLTLHGRQDRDRLTDGSPGNMIGHHMKVSLEAIQRHGTIEYRHHSGTLMESKIIPWIKLTGLIQESIAEIALGRPLPAEFDTLGGALEYLQASAELTDYWTRREAYFKSLESEWPDGECDCPGHRYKREKVAKSINDFMARATGRSGYSITREAYDALPASLHALDEWLANLPGMSGGWAEVRKYMRKTLHVTVPIVRKSRAASASEARIVSYDEENSFAPPDGEYLESGEAAYLKLTKAGVLKVAKGGEREPVQPRVQLQEQDTRPPLDATTQHLVSVINAEAGTRVPPTTYWVNLDSPS